MARPKIVQLMDGKVELKGFPKEIQDKLEEYVLKFDTELASMLSSQVSEIISDKPSVELVKPEQAKEVSAEEAPVLTERAIGVCKSEDGFIISTVKFNPITGMAAVEKLQQVGAFKRDAVVNFKLAATELGFV